MRPLLASLFLLFALALPVAALATDAPSPTAVAACQSEYAQIGADAFKAKYGATEPFGHCYQAHAPAVTTTTTTTSSEDDPMTAACKAEYVKLGPDAFKAKYGTTETFGNCLKAHTSTKPATTTTTSEDDPATAACRAEYVKLGPDAFKAKYGATEAFGNCLKAHTTTKPGTTTTASDQPKPPHANGDDGAASVASAFCSAQAKALGKVVFLAKFGPKDAMGTCVKAALAKAKSLVAACKANSGSNKDAFKTCIAAGVQPRRR
jgi:hypothetical protein